jgi:hypothetical protein
MIFFFLFQSADEKLRNFGGKQSGKSNTIEKQPPLPPRHSNSLPLNIRNAPLNAGQDLNSSVDAEMADRRTQRGSNNKQTTSYDSRSAEVKRRSRSAGPSGKNKMRNSMDEKKFLAAQEKKNKASRYYQRRQELKQGTRHSLYNEPESDEGGFPNYSSSASDSDGNKQTNWVKNPLNTKKGKKFEKRQPSGNYDNGVYSINENEYNRLESQNIKNRQPTRLGLSLESEYQDKNGNSKNNKFQKLEERRNQRIDFTVTSDDEVNSPEAGISKLRQRALQGSKPSTKLPDTLEDWNFSSNAPQVGENV